MFKWVKSSKSNPVEVEVIEWTVEFNNSEDTILAKSILNLKSSEYQSFLDGMVKMLDAKGYNHATKYDHKSNRPGSKSMYYTFIKQCEDKTVQVVVEIRVSNHSNKSKNGVPHAISRKTYRKYNVLPQIMKDTNTTNVPQDFPMEIIFNDQHFTDYISALSYVNRKVNQLP